MKKKKAGKLKNKKNDKKEEDIKPTKHENVGNVNFYSEEIAKEIINKLISYTFTGIYMKKMNKKIDDYYSSNLFNTINNIVEICYINHEIEKSMPLNTDLKNKSFEIEPKKKKLEKKIKEKKIYNKNNIVNKNLNDNSDLILNETYNNIIDKDKYEFNKLLYNVDISNNNFWDTIPEPESFSFERTCTYHNVTQIGKRSDFFKKEKTSTFREKKSNKFVKLKSFIVAKKFVGNILNKKKKYVKASEELPSEKIPDEVLGIRPEDDDIKNMRKILLEEIERKNWEEKKEKEKKRLEEIAKKQDEKNKKSKNKDKSEQGLNPDLFIKQFISVSSNQKEIKPGSSASDIEEEMKKLTQKAKLNIEYNKIKKIKSEKEQMKENKMRQKLFYKKYLLKSLNKDGLNINDEDEENNSHLNPSGSNFGLIKPEVGVIVQENLRIKSGGINFFEKFNKFSLNDFNKTMNSILDKKNFNLNNYDSNNYTSGKINTNTNNFNAHLNNTSTAFNNNNNISLFGQKMKESLKTINTNTKNDNVKDEELNEKKLFTKTFMNKLANLKQKFLYKSKSEICMSNNYNSNILQEALSTEKSDKSYYYYSSRLFDSNRRKSEFNPNSNFELNYIGKKKILNKKFLSPIPTDLLKIYKNTLLKNYFYNACNDYTTQESKTCRYNKYHIIDTFNKNLVDGNIKYNELFDNKNMRSNKNSIFPKIKYNGSTIVNKGTRTKNYFFRTRMKQN